MNPLREHLARLSDAEDFLRFFDIAYDPHVVQVNRLHILQRFRQYLRRDDSALAALDDTALRARYRGLLQQAHDDFVHSTAAREKVFKVFQDAGQRSVPLDQLSRTLPSRA